MTSINIHAAKTHFSQLVDRAAAGEEIIIARAGKPVARLTALAPASVLPKRVLGRLAGQFVTPANYDDPLPEDVLASFEGG